MNARLGDTVFWWEDDLVQSGSVLDTQHQTVTVRTFESDQVLTFFAWQSDVVSTCKDEILAIARQDILGRIEELNALAAKNGISF